MDIIESHSDSAEMIKEGSLLITHFCKLKTTSIIQPENYKETIMKYFEWIRATSWHFYQAYLSKSTTEDFQQIMRSWDWNNSSDEGIFFGGSARPLHIETVNQFSNLIDKSYDSVLPSYKRNRAELANALIDNLNEQAKHFWPDYEIFFSHSSIIIISTCYHHFILRDPLNTWFVQSSASDYIPFVHLAREIFGERFIGSNMTDPSQHTSDNIKQHCLSVCEMIQKSNKTGIQPIIVILLTSKNRYGQKIDVDAIHTDLTRTYERVVTIVDGCQDSQPYNEVDIIIYSKRFATRGAICLLKNIFNEKNSNISSKLRNAANFPIRTVAQTCINLWMMNNHLAHGVYELVNSSCWPYLESATCDQLRSAFQYEFLGINVNQCRMGIITYTFIEDLHGTIITLRADGHDPIVLCKLWALLTKRGHTLDPFLMDNIFLSSPLSIKTEEIRDLINRKAVERLLDIELRCSDYLAWPLLPGNFSLKNDMPVEQLHEFFDASIDFHKCLRIFIGRNAYAGKLKRFIQVIDDIVQSGDLNKPEEEIGKWSASWPV